MMQRPTYGAGMPLAVGFLALAILIGGVGLWSVRTHIAGAVIANGVVVVESNRQVIQHDEGGVVGDIAVRDGDEVAAGDLLIRLDGTLLKSELAVAELQLVELQARRARLEAERDGAEEVDFPELLLASTHEAASGQLEGQRQLFAARHSTFVREVSQIDERETQTRNEIEGLRAQFKALKIQQEITLSELADQEALFRRGLVQLQRVLTLRREAARLAGEIGRLTSEIAQAKGRIAAFEIEKLKLGSKRHEAAIAELRDIRYRELELSENRSGLLERMSRLEIRAPVSGVVYGLSVFARKAVIRPAEPLLYLIPRDRPLIVSARVEAIHIDQVHIGQPATLHFTAFNQRTTPVIEGRVVAVSADVFEDEVRGVNYYRIDLIPRKGGLAKLEEAELLPGMPVEAFLRTADRTPLSYLTKPLTDYFGRSFREG